MIFGYLLLVFLYLKNKLLFIFVDVVWNRGGLAWNVLVALYNGSTQKLFFIVSSLHITSFRGVGLLTISGSQWKNPLLSSAWLIFLAGRNNQTYQTPNSGDGIGKFWCISPDSGAF